MEIYIVAVLFLKGQFSETIVQDAITKAEAQIPALHAHPEETYILTEATPAVSVIFYEVRGYPTAAGCFQAAVELFRDQQFPTIIKACAKQQRPAFCFYTHMFTSTADFMITSRYDDRGFDERHSVEGTIMRIYGRDNSGGVKMEDHDAADKEAVRMQIVGNYLAEKTKVTQKMLTEAWMHRYSNGTVIAAWKDGVRIK